MGYHMAGHLATKLNDEVIVWHRIGLRARQWVKEFSGKQADSIAAAVYDADVVFTCLGRDEDVEAVLLASNGAIEHLKAGAMLIDHTTTSAQLSKTLAKRLAQMNIAFMDAPVSGGEEGAKNGALSCMLGGDAETLAKAKSWLDCYAHNVVLIGDVGSGQLAKMVNQICIAGVLQGLSEGILFAEAEQLNVDTVLAAISGGAAQSWQMNNRGKTMHAREFDFGFALKWMIKDLSYCLDQAQKNGVDLKNTEAVISAYRNLQADGHEDRDTSALIRQLDNND